MTHTPGPWRVGLYDNTEGNCHKIQIETEDRKLLAPAYAWNANSKEQCLEDAHLIAAAPEMLETLRNLVGVLDIVSPDYEHDSQEWAASHVASECVKCILDEHIKTGHAAIAKAEGRKSD